MSFNKRYLNQEFIKNNIDNIYDLLISSDALISTDELSREVIKLFNEMATKEEIMELIRERLNITNQPDRFKPFEPKLENRFIIKLVGADIPPYLFQSYSIKNVGEDFVFKTKMMEIVGYTFNPEDLLKINSITIEDLDAIGGVIGGYKMDVVGSNMKIKTKYSSSDLKTIKFKFIVKNFKTI